MKLTKNLFWAFAGLGLVACSGEEIVPQGSDMDGNAVVEVTIAAPNDFNRSLVAGTTGANAGKIKVNGTLTIKLETASGATQSVDIPLNDQSARGTITHKFWGVKDPTKVTAYINDGDKVNNDTEINSLSAPNMQAEPEDIPAYGESTTFKLSGKTEVNSEDGKTYEMYDANVVMKIPVARLEVSNIKHVDKTTGTCKYSALSIDGIYLDKLLATKGSTSVTDYCYPAVYGGEDGQTVIIPAPVLWDQIAAPNDFMDYAAKWPVAEGQAFAYNFYPSEGQQPILKIYFKNATSSDPNNIVAQPRYAMVKTYNGQEDFKFEAGKIYRITSVNLNDDNIIGDEEGNTLYGVNVNVEEAEWTIADISAEWTE